MVGPRPELDRLLKQPIEKQPPSARVTTVEAKGELVQVVVQVLVADLPLRDGQVPRSLFGLGYDSGIRQQPHLII